ncbi:helix-turn-helix transcriptional regulator [Georgenia sp. MJ170]|uniref:helix-turn-helix transcriptional regulator n=1 Tax=Georgenia sunbinii TaxID=3117728 RepID=UPI002F265D39
MSDPTARSLRLLSLLQTHRHWSGEELRDRLRVSERTLRRDIDRLRELGYDVAATPGAGGGYQLAGGGRLPPLLLDDDEAVAIAVGLRTAAVQGLSDGEHTSLSALAKLEQMLAPHLRRRVSAFQETAVTVPGQGERVDADLLAQLALACRDHERVRFGYVSRLDVESSRHVEPHSLVPMGSRWYLVCWDLERADWRTFRADRMARLLLTGVRSEPRTLPAADAAEFVQHAHVDSRQPLEAVVHLDMTLARARADFGIWASGAQSNESGGVDWPIGGTSVSDILYGLGWIPRDVAWTVTAPDEMLASLRAVAARLTVAAR